MRIKTALMCGVCALISGAALAQDEFICHGLDRPACIPEYHKVVPERDVCFDQYTCDFKGFVCKSKFDEALKHMQEVIDAYNDLSQANKALINDYEDLSKRHRKLIDDYNQLLADMRR